MAKRNKHHQQFPPGRTRYDSVSQPRPEAQAKKEEPLEDKKKQKGKSPEKGTFSGIGTYSGYIYKDKNGSNPKR